MKLGHFKVGLATVLLSLGLVMGSGAQTATTSDVYVPSVGIFQGAGGHNQVKLINKADGRLRLKGKIQVNRIPAPDVAPENLAQAVSAKCTNAKTLVVALQINLIPKTASQITPKNFAVAANLQANNCYTVARAIQYNIQVDDPAHAPHDVNGLVNAMNKELNAIKQNESLSVEQAEARIDAVIQQFNSLASSMVEQRDETRETDSPEAAQIAPEEMATEPSQ